MQEKHWLLPDGIEELRPERAERLERLRRRIVDHFHACGFELVVPPMLDFVESLLTGTGHELDLQTFKVTDPASGRTLGIRADMTPQVARIDAHGLRRDVPTRLCYLGSALQARGSEFAASRTPMQIGAEIFGHAGVESDVEVIGLMLDVLELAGIEAPILDVGHVGIFRALAAEAGLDGAAEARLFDILQRKARPEMHALLGELDVGEAMAAALESLTDLYGGPGVLDAARERLAVGGRVVNEALDHLARVAAELERIRPGSRLQFDLGELRGYYYHTGVVFAAFVPGRGEEIARGGRYDEIGRAFGRPRPATGFSADLKTLVDYAELPAAGQGAIWAPWAEGDAGQAAKIRALRAAGERVIRELPGQTGGPREMGCDRQLVRDAQDWTVSGIE